MIRQELEALLAAHAHETAQLSLLQAGALAPVLAQARAELDRDLAAWLATRGGERYTAQAYRQSLLAIQAAEDTAGRRIAGQMRTVLSDNARIARQLAASHTAQEFALMAHAPGATEAMAEVPVRIAAALATGEGSLIPRYTASANRYAGSVLADLRRELAVGVVRGETTDALVARLQRLGGPTEGGVIPEGLFRRYEHWAERLVRTETAAAYNLEQDELYTDLRSDFPDLRRRWDASIDGRSCPRCQELHGAVIDPSKGEVFPSDTTGPPLHPNCRCRAGLWRDEWNQFFPQGRRIEHRYPERPPTPPTPPPVAPKPPKPPRAPRVKPPATSTGAASRRSPPAFASVADAERWAKRNYKHITWDFAGLDASLVRDVLVKFNQLAAEYPQVAKRLWYVGSYQTKSRIPPGVPTSHTTWSPNTYADASIDGRRIGLNPAWWGSRARLSAQCADDEITGWHVMGSRDIASVFTHEFGHQVEHWIESGAGMGTMSFTGIERASGFGDVRETWHLFRNAAANHATRQLSEYALTDRSEAWAESFAALHHTPRAHWTDHTRHLEVFLREVRAAQSYQHPNPPLRSWRHLSPVEQHAERQRLQALAQAMGIKQW